MKGSAPPTAAVIVAGGDSLRAPEAPLPLPRFVIAADSGLDAAEAIGLPVDLVVGDFDSASPESVARAERADAVLERHPADKDATDLELALEAALRRGLRPTVVLGGVSLDRIDHFLANALLLADPRYRDLRPTWWVGSARVAPVHARIELDGAPGDLVTLLAVGGPAAGVTTTGLRWALDGDTLRPGGTRGVSNEMTGPTATVAVDAGTLLAVHTPLTIRTRETP